MEQQSPLPEDTIYCELHGVRHVPPACDPHQKKNGSGATIRGSEDAHQWPPAFRKCRVVHTWALFVGGPIDGERRDCRDARGYLPQLVTIPIQSHSNEIVGKVDNYIHFGPTAFYSNAIYEREEMMMSPTDVIFFYRFQDLPLAEAVVRLFERYPAVEDKQARHDPLASEIDDVSSLPKMGQGQAGWDARPFVPLQELLSEKSKRLLREAQAIIDKWANEQDQQLDGLFVEGRARQLDSSGVLQCPVQDDSAIADPVGLTLSANHDQQMKVLAYDDAPAVDVPKTRWGFTLDKSRYGAPWLRKGEGNMIDVTIPLKNGDEESGITGDQTPRSFSFDETTHRLRFANENAATVDVIIEPIDESHN